MTQDFGLQNLDVRMIAGIIRELSMRCLSWREAVVSTQPEAASKASVEKMCFWFKDSIAKELPEVTFGREWSAVLHCSAQKKHHCNVNVGLMYLWLRNCGE